MNNKQKKLREQVRLKGRGKRVHKGILTRRGKGTTSKSRKNE